MLFPILFLEYYSLEFAGPVVRIYCLKKEIVLQVLEHEWNNEGIESSLMGDGHLVHIPSQKKILILSRSVTGTLI